MVENMTADRSYERPGFKCICESCGGLSIKAAPPSDAPATALVMCGGCNAVRGTLADLQELARRGSDAFEF
jgi:hypothetical protein